MLGDAGELGLAVAERARDLLRGIRVVPEVLGARLLAEVGDLGLEPFDADDGADVGERRAQRVDLVAEVEFDHVGVQPRRYRRR